VVNGEFSFTLPIPNDKSLGSFYSGLDISNNDARYVRASFSAFINNDTHSVRYSSQGGASYDPGDIRIAFYYVNVDVVVTGEYHYGNEPRDEYNLNLKAGWNMVLEDTSIVPWTRTTGNIPRNFTWQISL
jgi:hypothetical protein